MLTGGRAGPTDSDPAPGGLRVGGPLDTHLAIPFGAPRPGHKPPGRALRALPILASGERPPPRSVRVSVTDRCDFACTYCRPSHRDTYAEERLAITVWRSMFEGLRAAGVRRLRLTGGEPLLHPNIVAFVALAADVGFEDLSLTTNASQLGRLARPLREAGLQRVNVSVDTLDPARFREMTRGGDLTKVLSGVQAAQDAGLSPVKVNSVVLRGVNDGEMQSILRWAWERRMVPRFLELMPIAGGAGLPRDRLVTVAEMKGRLAPHVEPGEAHVEPGLGPAKYMRARHDPSLRVGFISGQSDAFCDACDRLRVSSTGVLRPCLATEDGVEAAAAARSGDLEGIAFRIAEAWTRKPDGKRWRGCAEESAAGVSMCGIGG